MAKGRMLNKTIRDDPRFNALSDASGLLFCMTIPHLDRDGIIGAETLWADVCPRKKEWATRMDDLIGEWVDIGLVIRYGVGLEDALCFPGFSKNQTLTHYNRESESVFPPPPGYTRSGSGLTLCKSKSGPTLAEVEVKGEGKEEVKGEEEVKEQPQTMKHSPPLDIPDHMRAFESQMAGKNVKIDRSEKVHADDYLHRALESGIKDAAGFTTAINDLARILKYESKINVSQSRHNEIKEAVCQLAEMGVADNKGYEEMSKSWFVNDWRGVKGEYPTPTQFVDHVAAQIDGAYDRPKTSNKGPKSKAEASSDAVDNLNNMLKQEGIELWQQ